MPKLSDKSTLVIFTYASAGLGHLRVADALYHGLSDNVHTLLLKSRDKSTTYIHRLMSMHHITRRVLEWTQRGLMEELFTKAYKYFLQLNTKTLYTQLTNILDQRLITPKVVVIVATHFGLAHQIAALKARIEQENGLTIFLAVQLTDDSPQWAWYVERADLLFAPSVQTKLALEKYAKAKNLAKVPIVVSPYPISPEITKDLSPTELQKRFDQVDPTKLTEIHVAIPISGAAVGTFFYTKLVTELARLNGRYTFHIICKKAPFTTTFIAEVKNLPQVKLYMGQSDREIVEIYEQLYKHVTFAFEITKPSEQTFKALLCPKQRGGPVLFFANPVGRQEYDNLAFLQRHAMLPSAKEKVAFWSAKAMHGPNFKTLLTHAKTWRGLELPFHAKNSAEFIDSMLDTGILQTMTKAYNCPKVDSKRELGDNGVELFWQTVEKELAKLS